MEIPDVMMMMSQARITASTHQWATRLRRGMLQPHLGRVTHNADLVIATFEKGLAIPEIMIMVGNFEIN